MNVCPHELCKKELSNEKASEAELEAQGKSIQSESLNQSGSRLSHESLLQTCRSILASMVGQ